MASLSPLAKAATITACVASLNGTARIVASPGNATLSSGVLTVGANAITTIKLAANAVTGAKIATNTIETANIDTSAVTTVNIAPNSVTIAKLTASPS